MTIEDQLEIEINEEQIKKTLMSSDIAEFKDNKEEAEMMVDSLAEFLV
jgi:hypothetical protein